MAVGLRDQAVAVSDYLATSVSGVTGICLYGSVARGEDREGSDIDLLVVGTSPQLTPSALHKRLPVELKDARVTFAYYTPTTLDSYLHLWPRFGAHVRQEGEILFDRDQQLQGALDEEIPISPRRELLAQLRRLEAYDELSRFGGLFLFPLAHLYSIGRTSIFALLAEHGVLEFGDEQAMRRLAKVLPDAAPDIQAIRQLRPFREFVAGRSPRPLPFSPRDCPDEVATRREAIRRLIGRSALMNDGSD